MSHQSSTRSSPGLTRTGRLRTAKKGQRVHGCVLCGRLYSRNEHLGRHQTDHPIDNYRCDSPSCEYTFHTAHLLEKHKDKQWPFASTKPAAIPLRPTVRYRTSQSQLTPSPALSRASSVTATSESGVSHRSGGSDSFGSRHNQNVPTPFTSSPHRGFQAGPDLSTPSMTGPSLPGSLSSSPISSPRLPEQQLDAFGYMAHNPLSASETFPPMSNPPLASQQQQQNLEPYPFLTYSSAVQTQPEGLAWQAPGSHHDLYTSSDFDMSATSRYGEQGNTYVWGPGFPSSSDFIPNATGHGHENTSANPSIRLIPPSGNDPTGQAMPRSVPQFHHTNHPIYSEQLENEGWTVSWRPPSRRASPTEHEADQQRRRNAHWFGQRQGSRRRYG